MTAIRFFNAHIIDPSQSIDGVGYLDVVDGVVDVIRLGTPPKTGKFDQVIDCKSSCLSPGLVDMRVQPADPGSEHLESLATLLAAAANGGITEIGRAHVRTPVTEKSRMPSSA